MALQNARPRSMATQKWTAYQPTKFVLAGACMLAAIFTMLVGFSLGGWVTGGTSRAMAAAASEAAVGKLAANICVERFNAMPGAPGRLAEFKALEGIYKQRQYIEDGGWATMPGEVSPTSGAAAICATALAA